MKKTTWSNLGTKQAVMVSAALLLTGCAGLEMAHLAGQVLAQEVSTVVVGKDNIDETEGVQVYAVEMQQRRPYGFARCEYTGVMVEYFRDWEERDAWGNVTREADAEESVGYALILNKESCPNKAPRDIAKVGSRFHGIFGNRYVSRKNFSMTAVDYSKMAQDLRPKWIPQVLNTIKREADTNPAAATFLAELKSRDDLDFPL